MSWPVRSKRLAFMHAGLTANTPLVVGTVPSGKTWLVKDWSAFNQGASTRNVYIGIRSGGTDVIIDAALNLASGNPTGSHDRHVVLVAGESLYVQSTTNQTLDLQISGAQLG